MKQTAIQKVLAYVTRDGPNGREVLVFRRGDDPEAGIEVPGGTVETGEDLKTALRREVEEETGLTGLTVVSQVAKASFVAEWRSEIQERNVFHLKSPFPLRDTWIHTVNAGEEDKGSHFEIFWMDLKEAQTALRWGQGQWLGLI